MANLFTPEREVAGKKLKPGIFFGLEKSVLFISRLIEFVQKVSSKEVRHYFRKFDSSDKELINELAVYGVGYQNAFFFSCIRHEVSDEVCGFRGGGSLRCCSKDFVLRRPSRGWLQASG